MTEPLSPTQLELLLPALRHIAEMVKKSGRLDRRALQVLLIGIGLEDEWALSELERWTKVLIAAREASDPVGRELAQRALMLRGIPEAAAMLAVSIAASAEHEEPAPSPQRLSASVERLDLGVLPPGQGAKAELEVQGGPGQVVVESDQVRVTPLEFGPGTARLQVEVRPLSSDGVLWTTLKLITAGGTLEVPVLAQWQTPPGPPPPEPSVVSPPGREVPPIAFPAEAPLLALRGYFILPDLIQQGMERRLGRGLVREVIPLEGERVLVIAGGGAGLFDPGSGECRWEIDCPATCGALSPDRAILALGGARHIYLWDMRTGQFLRRLEGHTGWVFSVAFSPDGRFLASESLDGTVQLWEVSTGQEVRRLEEHIVWVLSVAFSPDGRLLALGGGDGTVRLWEVSTGQEVRRLEGHTGWVFSVAFSPDGRFLASGSGDRTVRLWEVSTGQEVRRLEGHTGWVFSVAFSPDGRFLASGSRDRTVRLWEVSTGRELRCLEGHPDWVCGAWPSRPTGNSWLRGVEMGRCGCGG